MTVEMSITSLAPWYGANRVSAAEVGKQLGFLSWVGVPFMGSGPELPHIRCRAGVANDKHRHIINLARVVSDDRALTEMRKRVDVRLFHPDELADAQAACKRWADALAWPKVDPAAAADYFVCAWMGRGGAAGADGELDQTLSARFTSSGGDSARRWRSAVESLPAWHKALRSWSFLCEDGFAFLDRCKDQPDHGLYVDYVWPEAGDCYVNKGGEDDQRRLAARLAEFRQCRVVVRYSDHPLIRELYPDDKWTWAERATRNQANNTVSEVLIINGERR